MSQIRLGARLVTKRTELCDFRGLDVAMSIHYIGSGHAEVDFSESAARWRDGWSIVSYHIPLLVLLLLIA